MPHGVQDHSHALIAILLSRDEIGHTKCISEEEKYQKSDYLKVVLVWMCLIVGKERWTTSEW